MPEAETQVYWHECTDPQPPWQSAQELQRTIERSRQLGGMRIAPCDFFLEPQSRRRRRRVEMEERADRGLLMEPGMTIFGVLNLLMEHLGREKLTQKEAADAVETIASGYRAAEQRTQESFLESQNTASQYAVNGAIQTGRDGRPQLQSQPAGSAPTATAQEVKEAPLLQCIRELLKTRNLNINVLNKKELRMKRNRVTDDDLKAGKKVAILVDRQRPSMAAVMTDGKVVPSAVRSSMHLMVPVAEPCPWRRRVFSIHGIDPLQAIVAFVYHPDMDKDGEKCSDSEASNGSTTPRNGNCSAGSLSDGDDVTVAPDPLVLPKRSGAMLSLMPRDVEGDAVDEPQNKRLAQKRTRSADAASTPINDQQISAADGPLTPSSSSSTSLSGDGVVMYEQPIGVPMIPSSGLQRAGSLDLALIPYAVRHNKDLVASALAQRACGPAAATAGFRRRVVSWMAPMVTALNHSTATVEAARQREWNLIHCGAHMTATGSGSTKLFFPEFNGDVDGDASGAPSSVQRIVDPFMALPSIEIPKKAKQRKHVRHSWTQRLIELERRGKLYAS